MTEALTRVVVADQRRRDLLTRVKGAVLPCVTDFTVLGIAFGVVQFEPDPIIRAGTVNKRLPLEVDDSLSPHRYQFVLKLIRPLRHFAELRGDRCFGTCEACENQKKSG